MSDKAPVGEGYPSEIQYLVNSYQSPRNIGDYVELLHFRTETDLLSHIPQNANLLDLGSGTGLFAKDLAIKRPDVHTFSINPALSKKQIVENQRRSYLSYRNRTDVYSTHHLTQEEVTNAQAAHDNFAVAGVNPDLPFPDKTFDVIFDSMSSIYYAHDNGDLISRISEILRVLKPEGFSAVGPVLWKDKEELLRSRLSSLRSVKFEEFEQIDLLSEPGRQDKTWAFHIFKKK